MAKHPNLEKYWNQNVSALATLPQRTIEAGHKERHSLYALCLMGIVHHYWNGLKRGRQGSYPWNPTTGGDYLQDDYRGHNIAAIAVDKNGAIIDFEFNHNRLFNSSAEHAEARLIRRIYNLTQISDSWDVNSNFPTYSDYNTFEEVTVYTTLESCSQCSGIMALARVKEVVYLQTDPGMYMIGNMLRNLTAGSDLESPLPVPGSEIGLAHFTALDVAYDSFQSGVGAKPFHELNGKKDTTPSITSFLCTDLAYKIYASASSELTAYHGGQKKLQHASALPLDRKGNPVTTGLTNEQVLAEAYHFYNYATKKGRRATPHQA